MCVERDTSGKSYHINWRRSYVGGPNAGTNIARVSVASVFRGRRPQDVVDFFPAGCGNDRRVALVPGTVFRGGWTKTRSFAYASHLNFSSGTRSKRFLNRMNTAVRWTVGRSPFNESTTQNKTVLIIRRKRAKCSRINFFERFVCLNWFGDFFPPPCRFYREKAIDRYLTDLAAR